MDDQLEKLQQVEIDILDEFVRVCDELRIQYFFECGSVLGAVRHQGFIPWDDDIDVGMMREDYNTFIREAPNYLAEKYYLESDTTEPNSTLLFSKLRNKRTVFDEGEKKVCNGIFIDIFPHDFLPDDEKRRRRVIAKVQKLRWLHIIQCTSKRKVAEGRELKWKIREMLLRIGHPFLKVFPRNFFKRRMLRAACQWDEEGTHWITCHYDAKPFQMNINDFFPLKKTLFCGKEYYIMKDADQYLKLVYGDYMKLPPKEKQIGIKEFPIYIID